jgi:hypothetical protein
MGGHVPLGYAVKDRKLFVVEPEAQIVRRIFRRFVELESVTELSRELKAEGLTTKPIRLKNGRARPGTPMDKKYLAKLLRNPLYVGEIRHKGKTYPGQHEAIIDRPLWEEVQAILAEDAHGRAGHTQTRHKTEALLRGLLYDENGVKYSPTFSTKPSGKRYRYYLPKADARYSGRTSTTGLIPAEEIEAVVVNLLLSTLQSPESIQGVWSHVRAHYPEVAEPTVAIAFRRLAEVWKALFPAEQVLLLNLLIERVVLRTGGIKILWREVGWKDLAGELAPGTLGGELLEAEATA